MDITCIQTYYEVFEFSFGASKTDFHIFQGRKQRSMSIEWVFGLFFAHVKACDSLKISGQNPNTEERYFV